MKRYLLNIGALLLATAALAQEHCGLAVTSASMQRNASLMTVDLAMRLSDFDLSGNRVVVFTPAIVGERDSLLLHPVGLYSRNRWYQYLRTGEEPLGGARETTIRWSERPDALDYSETVPYADWMNGAELVLVRRDFGCCREQIYEDRDPLLDYREVRYMPVFQYAKPVAATAKIRTLSGRAFVDFPVNRTELYPDYRQNPAELAKIIATIDSVRNDSDITVKRITIKGYASPEGSYSNNTRLAKGRTATLKQYVQNLYSFPEGFIETDYEPEDWEGLREFVTGSGLAHKAEILAIIDDADLDPDIKDKRIQARYGDEYSFLLQTVYPGLRHSDYTIEYTIREFTDLAEIGRLIGTAPQKLSLNEMMRYAQSLEPGSDAYNDVFETAVRMYPDSPEANLNAANSAMQRGDLVSAAKYLERAGDGPEAQYARGVYAALQGDYDTAEGVIRSAELPDTGGVLEHLEEVRKYR